MTSDLFSWQAAQSGMERAVEHADSVVPNWSERAMEALLEYARGWRDAWGDVGFLIEDVRAHATELPAPPDSRAWGAVVSKAARQGLIVKVGYAPAASSNCSPKTLWQRA